MNKKLFFALLAVLCLMLSVAAVPAEDEIVLRFQDWRLAEEPAATALTKLVQAF